jgi:hypothetical protein
VTVEFVVSKAHGHTYTYSFMLIVSTTVHVHLGIKNQKDMRERNKKATSFLIRPACDCDFEY